MTSKEILVFNSCCFCYSLKAGARIIGFGGIIACILGIMADIVIIVALSNRNDALNSNSDDFYLFLNCIFQIACLSIAILLQVLLLFGVHKKRPSILCQYMLGMTLFLLVWIAGSIAFTCLEPTGDKAIAIVPIPIALFAILIVRSLRKEMLQDSNYIQNKYSVTRPPAVSKQ